MPLAKNRILYEDNDLLIVNKLSGELVVKGKGRVDKLPLLDFIKMSYPGIAPVHRLDFETSGVVVFAKNKGVLKKIIENKFEGWVKKYTALLVGDLKRANDEIRMPLKARASSDLVETKTEYKTLKTFKGFTLVEATIQRGQYHQIRRHFAAIGHPLVLDDEHGDKKANRSFSKRYKYWRFFLHASSIDFPHPVTGQPIHAEAELPRTFSEVLKKL